VVGFHVRRGDKLEWVYNRNMGTLPDGPETLEHMRQTVQALGWILGLMEPWKFVIFAVASDENEWCQKNLIDPLGKLNVQFTHDRVTHFLRLFDQ